ncbi:hypothetical protein AGMMS49579_22110 [Spirochaetia bacterium]|nr:hypothetical protein AGMMS49579_22110 [Spirochaetia bacterium]
MITVLKIPEESPTEFKEINFNPFKELYLELLENKSKVGTKEKVNEIITLTPVNNPILSVKSVNRNRLQNDEDELYKEMNISRYQKQKENIDKKKQSIPPTYRQIEEQKVKEDNEEKKRELLFKFELLNKQYPNLNIPKYTMHSEYKSMRKAYEIVIRQLGVDSNAENYKNYLVGGFMFCEIVFGKFGFEMEGFTQQQILSMQSYDKLLIELGEKTYMPKGLDKWPVEARLGIMIFFNVVWFIASKAILKKTKVNLINIFNNAKMKSNSVPNVEKKDGLMTGPKIIDSNK